MAEIAIGIDLGTSNSCVAVARRTRGELAVEVLPNAYGETITASVVAFGEDGKTIVGNAARANIIHDPHNTVSSSKRLIGRYFFSEEVKKARAVCSYAIVEGPNHGVRIRVRGQDYALPEISAMVLREMKQIAELRLGQPVSKAVITVPAYFNDNQRQATKDAGRIAGLDVLRILNEPTAAALAYGFGKGLSQRVAIYDLGGGTFDISVLEIGKDVFEVLSTCGDTFLGGDDFDDRLIDLLADEFVAKQGFNLRSDPFALEKLKVAAEAAKRGLSMDEEVEINIPDIVMGPDGQPRSVQRRLTQAEYASLVMDLVMRTFKVCDEALQQANVVARDLAGVILVGGPTRLPLIRQAVRDYFQQEPRTDVNPDEVVAMGAAIHAASLVAPEQDAFLLDVTPLSLRIGVAGGLAETVIERNTPVPIEQTRVFTTFQDFQESVKIRVYQGESRQAEENELLGQFEFSGFKKARRGEVKIEVSFEINSDGIVNVMARDPDGGQQASTTITLSSGLSEGEIQAILAKGAPEAPAPEKPIARPVAPPSTRPVASPRPAGRPLPVADDELDVLPDDLPALPDLGPSTLDAQTEVAPVAPASKAAVPASAESGIPAASAPPDPDLEITGGYAQAPPPALAPDVGLDVGELEGAPDELVPLEGGEDLFDRHSADLSGGTDDLVVEIDLDPGPRKA